MVLHAVVEMELAVALVFDELVSSANEVYGLALAHAEFLEHFHIHQSD